MATEPKVGSTYRECGSSRMIEVVSIEAETVTVKTIKSGKTSKVKRETFGSRFLERPQ